MDPLTAGAIALATLLLNKSAEKSNGILVEKAIAKKRIPRFRSGAFPFN
jgi:hypothetical protein